MATRVETMELTQLCAIVDPNVKAAESVLSKALASSQSSP